MDIQNRRQEFRDAWKAFSGAEMMSGWRTIPISPVGRFEALAGRRFPNNEEAILISFPRLSQKNTRSLPTGRGFEVLQLELEDARQSRLEWIVLVRSSSANSDLFLEMAADVTDTLGRLESASDELSYAIFAGRIAAWQDFMQKDKPNSLSNEEEIGLWGELRFLSQLLELGVSDSSAVDAWKGPLDGIQDFIWGESAVEVKTTTSRRSFVAKISSLDQLDSSDYSRLFLVGFKLASSPLGTTLAEEVERVRAFFDTSSAVVQDFNNRLIRAGYLDSHRESYLSKYEILQQVGYQVEGTFPRVTKDMVAEGVITARYEIDLGNLYGFQNIQVAEIVSTLGAR